MVYARLRVAIGRPKIEYEKGGRSSRAIDVHTAVSAQVGQDCVYIAWTGLDVRVQESAVLLMKSSRLKSVNMIVDISVVFLLASLATAIAVPAKTPFSLNRYISYAFTSAGGQANYQYQEI